MPRLNNNEVIILQLWKDCTSIGIYGHDLVTMGKVQVNASNNNNDNCTDVWTFKSCTYMTARTE